VSGGRRPDNVAHLEREKDRQENEFSGGGVRKGEAGLVTRVGRSPDGTSVLRAGASFRRGFWRLQALSAR